MVLERAIVHVMNRENGGPILTDFETIRTQQIDDLLTRQIKKCLGKDYLLKASYKPKDNLVGTCAQNIIYNNDTFIENSKQIAQHYYNSMLINKDIPDCDLAICLYNKKGNQEVAILVLEYKQSYTHSIENTEGGTKVKLQPHNIGLPSATQEIKKAAFIGISGVNDDYNLEFLDKKFNMHDDPNNYLFLSYFLNSVFVMDDKIITKTFRDKVEGWVKNNFYDDIDTARVVRERLFYELKNSDKIDIQDFIDTVVDDNDLIQGFIEYMDECGLDDKDFNIDKAWVEKKLKKKTIKTDTGFKINANTDEFDDALKYQMKKNADGSVDVIIKNVKFYEEN